MNYFASSPTYMYDRLSRVVHLVPTPVTLYMFAYPDPTSMMAFSVYV